MDRASILGDAIEYLKELLQRVNDVQIEMESESASHSSLAGPTSACFNPSTPTIQRLQKKKTPTLQTFPGHVKEELRPVSFPIPDGK
jgi:hypothetical protein